MITNLIEKCKSQNIDLEVLESSSNHTDITTINDKVNLFQISNNKTYCLKAIKDGKCITLSTGSIDNPDELIESINTIFELQENDNKNRLSSGKIDKDTRSVKEVDYQRVKRDLLEFYDELKYHYSYITSVEFSYTNCENEYLIENSNSHLNDNIYFQNFGASITISKNDVTKITYVSTYLNDYNFDIFKEEVIRRIEDLYIKLNSDSCVTNKYNIILKNDVVASILSSFDEMFDSKNIYLKESLLSDKFNEKVFSSKLNIIEDPQSKKFIVSRQFDDEGVKTSKKGIIKNGVFVKKINDLEYAIKNNEDATGNSYGVLNLYIEPGEKSFNELKNELKNGIIIDELMGLHSGIDLKDGNISLQAEGYLLEDGKITKGLSMIILSTNLLELFNNIREIGNDLSRDDLSVFAPSLLIDNITITGKK